MDTKVVCPVCGAEFAIAEHEHMAFTTVIGKDSNLGVVHPTVVGQHNPSTSSASIVTNHTTPKTSKEMKASEKLQALANAGVNVANLFAMAGINGQETIARMENGALTIVPEDDPIFAAIMGSGTVPNNRLFRRWVMSQVFHMMLYKSGRYGQEGFTAALNAKGFKYAWRMMVEEFRVQAKLEVKDHENFVERNRWFNKGVAIAVCNSYMQELEKRIDFLKRAHLKHCKGVEYLRLRHRNVFVSDIQAKVIAPLQAAMSTIANAPDALRVFRGMERFYAEMQRCYFEYGITISPAFKDAYKGAGAYFTMKNLILFHKATFKNGCVKMNKEKSLALLEEKAIEYTGEGWRLFGLLKKLLLDSNIDVEKKIRSWKK